MEKITTIEQGENLIFEAINRLDIESYKLYCEVNDLSNLSLYKAKEIAQRLAEMKYAYEQIKQAYDMLDVATQNKGICINNRKRLKLLLAASVSTFAFVSNATLGILSLIVLNSKVILDFFSEIVDYENNYRSKYVIPNSKLELTEKTIENSERIYNGRIISIANALEHVESEDDELYIACRINGLLELYLNGDIEEENITEISDEYKKVLIKVLKSDLNSDNDDLITLLHQYKDHTNNLGLVKKLGIS